jgi:hypothetical protein
MTQRLLTNCDARAIEVVALDGLGSKWYSYGQQVDNAKEAWSTAGISVPQDAPTVYITASHVQNWKNCFVPVRAPREHQTDDCAQQRENNGEHGDVASPLNVCVEGLMLWNWQRYSPWQRRAVLL